MPTLDTTSLLNLIASGLVGFVFGSLGTWYAHRLQLKRENLAWQHEKEKLQERFEQEKNLLELQFQQKMLEIERQVAQQQASKIKAEILRGIDKPTEAIIEFKKFSNLFYKPRPSNNQNPDDLIVRMLTPLFDSQTIFEIMKELDNENKETFRKSLAEVKSAFDAGDLQTIEFEEKIIELLRKLLSNHHGTG